MKIWGKWLGVGVNVNMSLLYFFHTKCLFCVLFHAQNSKQANKQTSEQANEQQRSKQV